MSNKVTIKLIRARYKQFCFGFTTCVRTYVQENYPVELILFQQALFPQQMSGDFREFSLSTLEISCGLITQALKLNWSKRTGTLWSQAVNRNLTSGWENNTQLWSVSVLIPKTSVEKPMISLTRVPKLAVQEQHPLGVSYSSPGS